MACSGSVVPQSISGSDSDSGPFGAMLGVVVVGVVSFGASLVVVFVSPIAELSVDGFVVVLVEFEDI